MLYLKALICKALFREFSYYAALSENAIDITFFEWGLHDKVGTLSGVLQEEIDTIDAGDDLHTSYPPYERPFDGILIGYGLCSNGVIGLSSKKHHLIIPRAHDCITLLLGSKERYIAEFSKQSGTFWLSPGWVESSRVPGAKDREWLFSKFCEKYDEESARMMVEMNDEMIGAYSRLALIEWPEFTEKEFLRATKEAAFESAEGSGLQSEVLEGDSTLIRDLLSGTWDEERFLVVPPGETVKASYDDKIIGY